MSIRKKKQKIKQKISEKYKGDLDKITRKHAIIDKLDEAGIPVGYWFLTMSDFDGSPVLQSIVEEYMADIESAYMDGKSMCFAGNQGTGKTMSSICILKEAIKLGYSAYYTTASDILNEWTDYKNSSALRKRLREVDFLLIDELDSRFFTSDSVKELFSGIYENVFRYRAHNTMPTIICTNETEEILNVFYGASVQSIGSLNKQYLNIIPVVGKDFRKRNSNE